MITKINNKTVYIVEHHHHVLQYWNDLQPKNIITFDYHTDARLAFTVYAFNENPENPDQIRDSQINDFIENKNIVDKIEKLRHDEHIDFALKTNIVKNKVFICFTGSEVNYSENKNIFKIGQDKIIKLRRPSYTNQNIIMQDMTELFPKSFDEIARADLVLENKYIKKAISNFKKYDKELLEDFVLDIDLDYFQTLDSINPKQVSFFYELVKKAKAITIATEPECVKICRLNYNVASENLKEIILNHINTATS